MGQGITDAGNVITRFGDFVDDVKAGGKKVHNTYDQLKETLSDNDLSPTKKN
jgi:hypothetical protein